MLIKYLHALVSIPWIYDRVQYLFGLKKTFEHLSPHLSQIENQIVLDAGAGTGNFAHLIPNTSRYIWLDNDLHNLKSFRKRNIPGWAVPGNVTNICLKDKSVDYVLCANLAHHLTDEALALLFSELARVLRKKMFFFEPLQCPESWISNALWKYDRGSHPRSKQSLNLAIQKWFAIDYVEYFTIQHHYMFCIGLPIEK